MPSFRRIADLVSGTWTRTAIASALLLAVFAVGALLAFGHAPDLRHLDLPGRPSQPPAQIHNPFSPGQMIDAAEARRVRADLLHDGEVELRAFQTGDMPLLSNADTGNRLAKLQELMAKNDREGVFERWDNRFDSITVGQLPDPNLDPTLPIWCVEERGHSAVGWFSKATGGPTRSTRVSLDDKFWMVKVGSRYLITDAEVSTQQEVG